MMPKVRIKPDRLSISALKSLEKILSRNNLAKLKAHFIKIFS